MKQRHKKHSVMKTIFKTFIYIIGILVSIQTAYAQGLVPSEDQNYVMAVQAQAPFTTAHALETAPEDQKIQTITYYDGLGRPIQQNAINASTNNNDVISHIEYDGLGRQTKQYLPFEATGVTGSYREVNIHQDINAYYQNKYPDDFAGVPLEEVNAYSETILEASPLNRVQEQAAPGTAWKYTRHKDPIYASFPTDISYLKNWTASDVLDPYPPAYTSINLDNVVAVTINNAELKLSIWAKPELDIEVLSTGKLRKIDVYPEIEDLDLGRLTDVNDTPIDYTASIENNYLIITPIGDTPRPLTNGIKLQSTRNLSHIQYIKEYNEYVTNEHTVKSEYDLNNASEVLRFDVTIANGVPTLIANGTYEARQLSKSIVKNENWTSTDGKNKTAERFTDKNGRVILTRSYNSSSPSSGRGAAGGGAIDTYNVYDDYGNLTFVIPPKVNTADGISIEELSELIYQYRYDNRNRLIEKKDPGKGWEYIVYNQLDQPILTQDANQRKIHSGKAKDEWLFVKYDAFGRVTYTGVIQNDSNRAALQEFADNTTAYKQYETKQSTANTIAGTTIYYGNDAIPREVTEIHTINYYDNYNFDIPTELANPGTVYAEAVTDRTKTLPTGGKVRVLGTTDWTTTVTYYDKKARPICAASKNEYLSTVDIIKTHFDFSGKMTQSTSTHTKGNTTPIVTIDTFTYDHMGRVLTQTQKINDQLVEVIASNEYDNLGQLVAKNVGGGLQHVDYTFNIRGWLKGVNDINTMGNDLFSYKINYNDIASAYQDKALYNGNISQIYWRTANLDNTIKAYTYTYDALDRITKAESGSGKYDLTNITYDTMGNILTLDRKGHTNAQATTFGQMDNLSYTYEPTGHKLLSVTDTGNTTFGFKDGNTVGNDYQYDVNGSITADKNKGITSIEYNHLDLPVKITFEEDTNKTITYVYDAGGSKLKKILNNGGTITTTEYAAAQYKNGQLEFMAQPEGYVEKTRTSGGGEKYQYVYQYVDHLGNVRVSYTDNVDREEVSSTSTFDSGLQGWSNAEADQVVVENGRLKITAPSKWRGAHITTNNVAGRDKATLQLDVDMATTHKISVTLWQYRADGSYITRYGEYITQSGTHRIDSNIDPEAATLRIKVEKSYTPEDDGIATDFYIDNVLLLHQIVGLTIVEENNYYPFGLQQKGYNTTVNGRSHQYKYNNTELEEGLGLNWYEMPLRSYDPTIARWNRVDPVVHHGLSTYNAFDNNPIYYADPSGADSESPWNHDNRENTLDSRARAMGFGFSSIAARNSGVRGTADTNITVTSYGTNLIAALSDLGVDYSIINKDPNRKRKVTMMTEDLSDPIFEGGDGWTTEVMGDYSYYGSESSYEDDYTEFAGLSLADKNLLWNAKYSSSFGNYSNQLEGFLQERERQRRGAHLLHFGKFMAMMWGMGANYNISLKPLPTRTFNYSYTPQGVTLKYSSPQPNGISHTINISNGRVNIVGRSVTNGKFDYVITNNGQLRIGQGHYHLSGGASRVQMAGRLKIYRGKVTPLNGNSGHYRPTPAQIRQGEIYLNRLLYGN